MEQNIYIEAGKIVNTHGIAGEVKIEVWLDSPDFLKKFKRIFLRDTEIRVLSARVHKDMVIAKLEGYPDINAAMTLKGKTIHILRSDAKLPAGKYFVSEILGARVLDEEGREIGILEEAMETPANMVYIIRDAKGGEHLVPAVPEFIRAVDTEAKEMKVHLIEGM